MNSPTDKPRPCPTCEGQNTAKCVDSRLTEIHICRDCHSTFVIDKPQLTCPNCKGQNTAKSIESMLREIHVCRDCLRTFIIEKPPLRKEPAH